MARHIDTTPTLTPNNRIYLYRLLSAELGCGKQTFLPAVEEALASDRMGAEDLGFESTRALLEALEEFIKLTVFKGGRIYATVIAQPEWDAALEAAAAGKPEAGGKNGKPWKRKKTDKSLKPVRPKRVKKPEPVNVAEPVAETEPAPVAGPVAEMEQEAVAGPVAEMEQETIADAVTTVEPEPTPATPEPEVEIDATTTVEPKAAEASTVSLEPVLEPAISLTVTFDPYNGIVEETKMESHPVLPEPMPNPLATPEPEPAAHAAAPKPEQSADARKPAQPIATSAAPKPTTASAPKQPAVEPATALVQTLPVVEPEPVKPAVSPELLATYPVDFATEVYLDSERVAELCELLPYGTDVFKLLDEDYARARNLELISGTRARATFPLRIQHLDSIEPLAITLKKRSGSGLKWELQSVE